MARFSQNSQDRLDTCHTDLIVLFEEVVKDFDCSVICGYRTEQEQMSAYIEGNTQTRWPDSRHNVGPSMAVDVAPYPIDWNDRERFTLFAGFVLGLASALKAQGRIFHSVRWGGDWNGNRQVSDNKFDDLVHFELR